MSQLAINGGDPINKKIFQWRSSLSIQEKNATLRVIDSGVLSDYHGSWGERFLGGKEVQKLEKEWAVYFKVKYAVAVNSCTSGLFCSIGALGLQPGDEIIVPPYTMSASVAVIVANGLVPIFADIENDYYCLNPHEVENKITSKTKAIMVVNLFGQSADMLALKKIAKNNNLKIIEDNAQSPGALYEDKYTATNGDVGVFSLNCHKAIQCGEGGVVVSNDQELITRIQLIRNHAESIINEMGRKDLCYLVGHNFRMTEIAAAISREQLKKLKNINKHRCKLAKCFDELLRKYDFLEIPKIRQNSSHVYYLYIMKYKQSVLGITREHFLKVLNAEGYHAQSGYVVPLYQLPIISENKYLKTRNKPNCFPVVNNLNSNELWYSNLIRFDIDENDIQTFSDAIEKIASNINSIK